MTPPLKAVLSVLSCAVTLQNRSAHANIRNAIGHAAFVMLKLFHSISVSHLFIASRNGGRQIDPQRSEDS